jgi:lysophospholipase L1-like esterase
MTFWSFPLPLTRREIVRAAIPATLTAANCAAGPRRAMHEEQQPNTVRGMTAFHRALAELETGRRRHPVTILQLGDSHTANDAFGRRVREVLQDRFGTAGRGLLPPGVPFRSYAPSLVRVTADPGWRAIGSLDASNPGPFGISGLRQRAVAAGATMTLQTEAPDGLARAEVEILMQPDGGALIVEVDGRRTGIIATGAPRARPAFVQLPTGATDRRVALRAVGDGPVELLSWSAARASPGVLYANLGTIGATIRLIHRWDLSIVRYELDHLRPSLLLIAFGTNEAFRSSWDPGYGAAFGAAVGRLSVGRPRMSILIMGPPDGDWPASRDGGLPAPCPDGEPDRDRWRKPPHLSAVRKAHRRAAEANGWAFWDWSAAMGGDCAMHRWTQLDPPLGQPDHVHLRAEGYTRTADALARLLLASYDRARAGR